MAFGAALSLAVGVAFGTILIVDPHAPYAEDLALASASVIAGLAGAGLFLLMFQAFRRPEAPSTPPVAVAPPSAEVLAPAPARPGPDEEFRQMKTFIELEAWDLAYDKALDLLKRYPGTAYAESIEKNIHELRWKAEPKFADPASGPAVSSAKPDREAARMLRHLHTYMELEMWDLAAEKAEALVRAYPDAPEAARAAPILVKIRSQAAPSVPAKPQ